MPAATWTRNALRLLRKCYGDLPSADLAKRLGVSEQDVDAKASELALSKNKLVFKGRPMPRWTAAQVEELKREYPLRSNLELARLLGRSVKSITSKANKLELKKAAERLVVMGRENVSLRYTNET